MKNWMSGGLLAALLLTLGCGGDQSAPAQHEGSTASPTTPAPAPVEAPETAAPGAKDAPADGLAPEKKQPASSLLDSIGPGQGGGQGAGKGAGGLGTVDRPSKPSKSVQPSAPTSAAIKPVKVGDLDPADWTDIELLDPSIKIDIRYATEDNFTKSKVYDCPRCFLRPEAAAALVKAQEKLRGRGYSLKMFDCYRPRPYQQRLWDKVPNADYVTPPQKGSMHSRGAAVDLTIVDKTGKELDMGTPYDFFGEKAHADYKGLPKKILDNRKLLKQTLESVGFRGIRTEWWHFSFAKKEYELSSLVWPCN